MDKTNMGKKRNKKLFLGIGIIIILLFFAVVLSSGIFGEWLGIHSKGLKFFLYNEAYFVEYTERNDIEDCIFRFDFNEPEAAVGQVIYEENGTKIAVTDVEVKSENEIEFWFEASGKNDFEKGEGSFISAVRMVRDSNGEWSVSGIPQDALGIEHTEGYSDSNAAAFEGLATPSAISVTVTELLDRKELEDENERPVTGKFCEFDGMAWYRK